MFIKWNSYTKSLFMNADTNQHSFSSLFKNKAFLVLWANQFLIQLSYSMTNFALILWVYELTKKNTYVSFLLLAISIPSIIFGTFAGVVADRVNRRRIIQTTDILLCILYFFYGFSNDSILIIFVLSFLISIVSQFFLPAEGATIPSIVSKELLMKANSLFSLTIYASLILGNTLAGPIIQLGGFIAPFFVASFLIFLATVFFMKFPRVHQQSDHDPSEKEFKKAFKTALIEIHEGFTYILQNRLILVSIILLTAVQAFVSTLTVLIPEYVNTILQIPTTSASYIIMLPLGLGLIMGAFFNGSYAKYFSRRLLVEFSVLGVSVMLLALASAPVISDFLAFQVVELSLRFRRPLEHIIGLSSLLAIFSFLLGFFNVCIVIPAQTVLQENTSEELRGRVFGVLNMMMSSLAALPVLLVGTLSDRFGTVSLITTISLGVMFVGLFIQSKRFVTDRLLYKRDK
jgi:MFS family permease